MEWSKYLDLARELALQDGEAYKRSAVSRAYYAVYCTARDKLERIGDFNPPRCGSDHIYLWNVFAEKPYNSTRVRDLGQQLRDQRVEADYGPYIDNPEYFAEDAIIVAEELDDFLRRLRV